MEEIKKTADVLATEKLASLQAAKKKPDDKPVDGKASVEKPVIDGKEEVKEKPDAKTTEPHKKTEEEKQAGINARMAELTAKAKSESEEKSKLSLELEQLRKDKAELEKKLAPKEPEEDVIKKAEDARIKKYLEEDKEKPRSQRREMSDEELNAWLVEDFTNANRWVARRELRIDRERERDEQAAKDAEKFKSFKSKQDEYGKEVLRAHPELDTFKRQAELKAEGKTPDEITKAILSENIKVRIVTEIIEDRPELINLEDGPKRLQKELEKRLKAEGVTTPKDDPETKEKLERLAKLEKEKADLEAEIARRDNVDSDVKSSRVGESRPLKKLTEMEEKQEAIRQKAGISKERLDSIKARRSKLSGANVGRDDE